MSNYVRQAVAFFKQGDYVNAKKFYGLAAKEYGEDLFTANLLLCDRYLNTDKEAKTTFSDKVEDLQVKKLNQEIIQLKQTIAEKDANINERFEELAILTRMLEERDANVSAT